MPPCSHELRIFAAAEAVNAPQCNPSDEIKRCEVTVHGTRGSEKYYITEACPSAHPCNRCKDERLQRCAAWSPLAVDVCGTTWAHVFEPTRSEATGYVTLSCFPNAYTGESEALPAISIVGVDGGCYSKKEGDTTTEKCEPWCSIESAKDHCQWCKCRGCGALRDVCADIVHELEQEAQRTAAFLAKCTRTLDCKSWCNIGNCYQCPCAACERCGLSSAFVAAGGMTLAAVAPSAPLPSPIQNLAEPIVRHIAPAATREPVACHGWCVDGAVEDREAVCRSTKCMSCSFCV